MKEKLIPIFLVLLLSEAEAEAEAEENAAGKLEAGFQYLQQKLDVKLNEWGDQDRIEAIKRARVVPRGAKPELIIRRTGIDEYRQPVFNDGLRYNGKRLNQGDTVDKAIEVFGVDYIINKELDYEWVSKGITVISDNSDVRRGIKEGRGHETIEVVYFRLNMWKGWSSEDPDYPYSVFKGFIELDGAGIDNKTTVNDISALANREGLVGAHPYITCWGSRSSCQVGTFYGKTGIEINFILSKDRNLDGPMFGISLRFTR